MINSGIRTPLVTNAYNGHVILNIIHPTEQNIVEKRQDVGAGSGEGVYKYRGGWKEL